MLKLTGLAAAALALSACGKNLDAQCAALFEDLAKEFDSILDETSQGDVVDRLQNLKHEKRIVLLRKKASDRVSKKIGSGEIWSDLNPDAGPRPTTQRIVIEGVDRRKAVAMNQFNQRWFDISHNAKSEAGWLGDDEDNPLSAISELQSTCNQTLR
jgi:hypothetical protein